MIFSLSVYIATLEIIIMIHVRKYSRPRRFVSGSRPQNVLPENQYNGWVRRNQLIDLSRSSLTWKSQSLESAYFSDNTIVTLLIAIMITVKSGFSQMTFISSRTYFKSSKNNLKDVKCELFCEKNTQFQLRRLNIEGNVAACPILRAIFSTLLIETCKKINFPTSRSLVHSVQRSHGART